MDEEKGAFDYALGLMAVFLALRFVLAGGFA